MTAIAFTNVSRTYEDGRVRALDGVTLSVAEREFLAVVGPSGSGKTTLLQLINRLAEPTNGTVEVDGADVRAADLIALRRRVGYVFQEVGLFPHMTVAENIAVTPRLLGWDARRRAARVDELLDLVRLAREQRERYPHQLSGGERQRVGVARALAAEPRIVLMDEPFGALDPITRDALGTAYRAIHERLGVTTIMVTHDVQEAVLLADRIVVMGGGRILADGPPGVLLDAKTPPEVAELMAMPRRQAERINAMTAAHG